MKMILLILSALIALSAATDYCNKELCKEWDGAKYIYTNHIACGNSGNLGGSCPAGSYMVPLTPEHIALILKTHNTLRNKIASGNLPNFAKAKHLRELTWNDELAKLAQLNANQCQMLHDQCRNTDKFPYAGQNLASRSWYGIDYSELVNIEYLTNSWYAENVDSNQAEIDQYGSWSSSKPTGHFTVMVHEKTAEVGCAITRYTGPSKSGTMMQKILYVCNYSYTNMGDEPIYHKGEPCKECKTGCSTTYGSLCSATEQVSFQAGA